METVMVQASTPYPVYIGGGLLDRGGELISRHTAARRCAVITDDTVCPLYGPRLGRALDHGWEVSCSVEEEIAAACRALAGRLLTAKFVQGIPLVGAVGGAVNLTLYRRVSYYGALKYRKRFLEKRVRGI